MLAASLVALLAGAVPAHGAAGLDIGFSDGLFASESGGERATWLDRTRDARAGIVRVFVSWRAISAGEPLTADNPADPAYDFHAIDAAVRDATARNLEVLITMLQAPAWAEGANRDNAAPTGAWKPQPSAVGDFAEAVARRYSGNFPDPANPSAALPRVKYFQAWNEPNLDEYLAPQWSGGKPFAASHYRRMLNASYQSVHSVHKDNVMVTAGLAPYGDPPGGERSRPLRFWRDVFCLRSRSRLEGTKCPTPARFDVFGMHAINTSGPPRRSALNPDDASSADLDHLVATVRAAERARTVLPKGRHGIWVTEFWWESDPPDKAQGYPLRKQARYIAETMYLSWKAGAAKAIYLQIRDSKYSNETRFSRNSTGAYAFDGTPKPAVQAFRFPFVADEGKGKRVRVWGKAPSAGKVRIEMKRSGRWQSVAKTRAGSSRIFEARLRLPGGGVLRAVAGGETSLPWTLG